VRRLVLACVLTCLVAAACWSASGSVSLPSFWRYAHPEAKALVGIEWRNIVNSPFGEQMRRQIKEAGVEAAGGLEILDSIDRVFLSTPGNKTGRPNEQPPGVIAVQGRFDLARLREMAKAHGASGKPYKSVELLTLSKDRGTNLVMALVNSQTIVLGDLASVRAAIDQRAAADPGLASSELYRRAVELAETNDLWVVARTRLTELTNQQMAQSPLLNAVESVEAGLSFRDGMGVQVNLGTNSDEAARHLAAGLQMLLALTGSWQQERPEAAAIMRKLRIQPEGSRVQMAIHIDQKEMENGLRELRASWKAEPGGNVDVRAAVQGGESISPSGPEMASVNKPPRKKVIRIYGLEEGPREVPYQK